MKELYWFADSNDHTRYTSREEPKWVQLQRWRFSGYDESEQDRTIQEMTQKMVRVPLVRKTLEKGTYLFEGDDKDKKKVKVVIPEGKTVILDLVSFHAHFQTLTHALLDSELTIIHSPRPLPMPRPRITKMSSTS